MIARTFGKLLAIALVIFSSKVANAAQLQVRPVLVDVIAPGASSVLTLQNTGVENVNAQIRVFRWSQANGRDLLMPTRDVVASPPFVKMKPGGSYNLRIIRVSKRPVRGEESYRLIVDQILDISLNHAALRSNLMCDIQFRFSFLQPK